IVGIAVPTRTTMPVYQNIKAIGTADKFTLMATDLEVGIRYELRGLAIEEPGEAILPVGRLTSILRETTDTEVRLDADERRTRVNTSSSEYEMPGEDPASFADIADFEEGEKYHELAAGDLQRMIRRTVFAAAKDEGKYAMRGVLWDMDDKKAKLVATDGKRLAVASGSCVTQGDGEKKGHSHLVPPKAMSLLERILADGDASQPVQVCLRNNDALFKTERAVIYSRLVEGRFPPYRDVIPKKANAKVPLAVTPFLSAVRQAAIMTDDESKRITFKFAPGKLQLEAQGATTGKSKVQMKMDDYSGPAIDISFDPAYLTEMLRVVDGAETLQLDLVDGQKSAVFRSGEDYLYLVVPLV
ncbi:MAG TPA: DNA polymerase III subunit beta, partial [Gemmataceae bacterium]|nr:DNA polymerase III subunit beta [Gemmataceae bacterium]